MVGPGVVQPPPVTVASLFYERSPSLRLYNLPFISIIGGSRRRNRYGSGLVFVNKEDAFPPSIPTKELIQEDGVRDPQDLEYVSQIKTVLELLRKNRDMLFNEVKLTVMIEDPRDVERRRLLGIDDENAPTRDDLAATLVEVEAPEKQPGKSLYAKVTNTGVDMQEAAKRLNIDWDSAAEIEDAETDDVEVPPAVGYGALYLVTAFPVIIGISVVLILFYNSLQ